VSGVTRSREDSSGNSWFPKPSEASFIQLQNCQIQQINIQEAQLNLKDFYENLNVLFLVINTTL
jgi:hypothetical protein